MLPWDFLMMTEYIEAIREANEWGSSHYLRKLFVTMLLSDNINRLEDVWNRTWQCLFDGILYEQKKLTNIASIFS